MRLPEGSVDEKARRMQVDKLIRGWQLAEGVNAGVQVPAGRCDVTDGLSGKGKPASDPGYPMEITDPFEFGHGVTPSPDGGLRLTYRLARLPEPLQEMSQQFRSASVTYERDDCPQMASGLVVRGETIRSLSRVE